MQNQKLPDFAQLHTGTAEKNITTENSHLKETGRESLINKAQVTK